MKRICICLVLAVILLFASVSALATADMRNYAPSGMTLDGETLLVTDVNNRLVWIIENGETAVYAGCIASVKAYADGPFESAQFLEPWTVAPFLDGYLVTDAEGHAVRYLADGKVYTAAGNGEIGSADGKGTEATLYRPTGLAVGDDGRAYIADTGNGSIRVLDTEGGVTTLLTGLDAPTGLCWADGALYIVETGANRICRLADGDLETLAGGEIGYADGSAESARFNSPLGVTVAGDAVYIADTGNSAVRKLQDGVVSTMLKADLNFYPKRPRGLTIRDGELLIADVLAGKVFAIPLE